MDTPLLLPITKIISENPFVKTFFFDYRLTSRPGQFVMVWIPGLDQKPFSIGYDTGEQFGLTIFAVGPMSNQMFKLNVGDRVGITGPYGRPFTIQPNGHYITVGGGYGSAPLGFLAEELSAHNATVDFCIGARTAELLLFVERVKKLPHVKLHIATNDGSAGHKGFVTDLLEECLTNRPDREPLIVSTCGPELMEKKVLDICNANNVDCEISIERYMKCGFGVCGQCCVDPLGLRMCVEGPVVPRHIANQLTEFGVYHRDKSGRKIFY